MPDRDNREDDEILWINSACICASRKLSGRADDRAGALQGGAVVCSLWPGYLDQPSDQQLTALLTEADVPLVHHHSSGHAHPEYLARLVETFSPARVVPIHSEATDRFAEQFPRVETHDDHEWCEV